MYKILVIISKDNENTIKFGDKFLWEYAVENIPSDCVVISAPKNQTEFWEKYLIEKKPSKPFSIFFEKYYSSDKYNILSNLPRIFTSFRYKNPQYIITPILYCEDFSFTKKMWEKGDCIAIKRMDCKETDYTVDISWLGKIKKISSGKRGYSWKVVGTIKTSEQTINKLLETNKMISSLQEAISFMFNNLKINFDYVKVRGRISYDGKIEENPFPLYWFLMNKELKKFEYLQSLYNGLLREVMI